MSKLNPLLILILILSLNLAVRIRYFDYPMTMDEGDGMANYLVAFHISHFKEHIGVGPFNSGTNDVFKYSPFYYYFLAFFVNLNNSPMTLWWVNIFLQMLIITGLYIIGEKGLGRGRGVMAAILYGFTPFVLEQSYFIWQPYVAGFFIYLGLFAQFFAWKNKNYKLLLLSLFSAALAVGLHSMSFALLPLFILTAILILKDQKRRLFTYIVSAAVFILTWLIIQSPLMIAGIPNLSGLVLPDMFAGSLQMFLNNLAFASLEYLRIVTSFKIGSLNFVTGMMVLIFITLIYSRYFHVYKQNTARLKPVIIMSLYILGQIFFTGLLSEPERIYLLPVTGISALLIVELSNGVISGLSPIYKNILKVFVVIILAIPVYRSVNLPHPDQPNQKVLLQSVDVLEKDIATSKTEFKITGSDFFRIRSYYPHPMQTASGVRSLDFISDAVILALLEKKSGIKLTTLVNYGDRFRQLNSDRVIYLICYQNEHYSRILVLTSCRENFKGTDPEYLFASQIFDSQSLTIFKYLKKDLL